MIGLQMTLNAAAEELGHFEIFFERLDYCNFFSTRAQEAQHTTSWSQNQLGKSSQLLLLYLVFNLKHKMLILLTKWQYY